MRVASLATLLATLFTAVAVSSGPVPSASALASPNIARYGYATQSSTSYGGTADRANDGNTDGNFSHASTTATARELNPWWQVDLGRPVDISAVDVWNRTDCCADRLSDYWVFLSPIPFTSNDPAVLANARGVTAIHMTSMPQPEAFIGTVAMARYVRVQLSGTNYLSLSEVQVFGNPEYTDYTNFAYEPWPRRFVDNEITQSSVAYGGDPYRAVDQITDGRFVNGSVATTGLEANPWWEAALPESHYLYDIRVWNRTDCCTERLSNFWVFVSDQPFTSNDPKVIATQPGVKATRVTSAPSPRVVVPVGTTGKYVRIQIEGTQYLTLAEVEINGRATELVTSTQVSQSSTDYGGIAQRAQDGNTNGQWSNGSVTATAQQTNPWWQIDLGELPFNQFRDINSINIWNRTDCCIDRLNDYWIFVSNSPFTSDNPNVTAAQPGVTAYHITKTQNPLSPLTRLNLPPTIGRYIRIQIPGNGLLSLAEVQVYAIIEHGPRL